MMPIAKMAYGCLKNNNNNSLLLIFRFHHSSMRFAALQHTHSLYKNIHTHTLTLENLCTYENKCNHNGNQILSLSLILFYKISCRVLNRKNNLNTFTHTHTQTHIFTYTHACLYIRTGYKRTIALRGDARKPTETTGQFYKKKKKI